MNNKQFKTNTQIENEIYSDFQRFMGRIHYAQFRTEHYQLPFKVDISLEEAKVLSRYIEFIEAKNLRHTYVVNDIKNSLKELFNQ